MASDEIAVMATNDDATTCKLSCVNHGYWSDPFISLFCKTTPPRAPLIHRGYFSRVAIINSLILSFIQNNSNGKRKQIVILGAGFDTTFFQLMKKGNINSEEGNQCVVYEVDYDQVASKKVNTIKRNKILLNVIQPQENQNSSSMDRNRLHSDYYHILSADLNNIEKLEEALVNSGIEKDAPTLWISECVLIYLKPECSDNIIQWVSKSFPISAFATYEQIKPNDPFGKVMMENLEKRGCPLLGASAYPSLQSQIDRYKTLGFEHSEAFDMLHVYNKLLDENQVKRIQQIEFFDEYEEWELIQSHYCLLWAWQDRTDSHFWRKSLSSINS